MFEKILVPLDGSRLAEVALPYAEAFAKDFNSDVTLLHVVDIGEAYDGALGRARELHQQVKAMGTEYLHGIKERLDERGIRARPDIHEGRAAEGIIDYSERHEIGLIIMSTHGQSGNGVVGYGSVADKVLRGSQVPLLLIRAPEGREPFIRRILVPLDGSPLAEEALRYAAEVAERFNAELITLRIIPVAEEAFLSPESYIFLRGLEEEIEASAKEYLEIVTQPLNQKGVRCRNVTLRGYPATQITDYASLQQVDLTIISTHGRSGVGRWAYGSVADKVLRSSGTPVLVIRPREVSEGSANL